MPQESKQMVFNHIDHTEFNALMLAAQRASRALKMIKTAKKDRKFF